MSYLAMMKQHPDGGRSLRRAWSDALCARVSRAIDRDAPVGIGAWDPFWTDYLAEPEVRMHQALARWELHGLAEDKGAATTAARDVYAAFQQAVKHWRVVSDQAA
jgi:hypothetical protein